MDPPVRQDTLPESSSSELHLAHPTPEELVKIWTSNSATWRDSLTLPAYIKEQRYMTTVPLAKDNGLTFWILVDKNLASNERPILSSCETLRKRSLTSNADGNVEENIVHAVTGVFSAPAYRRRGYAARLMAELAKALHGWQTKKVKCVGSILYSDIGKTYYAKLGWQPNSSNTHVVIVATAAQERMRAQGLTERHLGTLCQRDEDMIRSAMATSQTADAKKRVTVLPDLAHMLWHLGRENFVTELLFAETPCRKGAIAGPPGKQVWAIWTHRYYGYPGAETAVDNVLHILRLVVETEPATTTATVSATASKDGVSDELTFEEKERLALARLEEQAGYLREVLQMARAEAKEWRLACVEMWVPSPRVHCLVALSGVEHRFVQREEQSIASGLWYDENGDVGPMPQWLNNEYYAWL